MIYESEIRDIGEASALLRSVGLFEPGGTDYTVGVYDDGRLVGAGSLAGDIIVGVAVDPSVQGEGVSGRILSALIREAVSGGRETLYLFTLPEKETMFASLGFRTVAKAPPYAVMLEWGSAGIEKFKASLRAGAFPGAPPSAAVVVNCNPFTKGHRYLIEKAAQEKYLYVIVVEEDLSEFPFPARLEMVRRGTADLRNVKVFAGGRYVVSSLTFPSYFTKKEDVAAAHASMDLAVFAEHVAPALNIGKRYVGTEPYSAVTRVYNEHMKKLLPERGIKVHELERLGGPRGIISASKVRALLAEGKTGEAKEYLPETSWEFIGEARQGGKTNED